MNFDPIALANSMRESYAEHYAGSQPQRAVKNLVSRYHEGSGESLESDLPEFIRTKGPYLQVLDLPRMSDTPWETFADDHGLHDDIAETFTAAGFRTLYEFQEDAVESVLEDHHTLLTASTGRGKTEGWLIPILQFITEAKAGEHENHPPDSVKCVLTYPTKALAQDQLKRLIDYLFTLNRGRTSDDQITVGIYDGDTKRRDPDELSYLQTTFQYFDCPCGECDSSLTVRQRDDDSFVVEPLADHEDDITFGFIKVTRDAIVESPADILLTNPDTINYRLFNVNEGDEQRRFVAEPKYFVFDEIHEYSELFGSFTSALMRRYIRERQELNGYDTEDEDDLTIVGASATVENKRTVFQRINPFVDPDVEVIEEEERTIDAPFPTDIPDDYLSSEVSEDELRSGETTAAAQALDAAGVSGDQEDVDDALYELLVEEDGGPLEFVRGIYAALREKPLRPVGLRDRLVDETGLTENQAETVVANFMTIGEVAGILERRAHLFSWPLDGYYTCINCGTVYDTPQSSCTECDHHFVTKLSLCNECGEESLESWFCPNCERLAPHTVTSEEGRFEYFQREECQCETVDGETPEMVRVHWRPYYECTDCGERQKIDHQHDCPVCDAALVLDHSMENHVCTNPDCDGELTVEEAQEPECHSCHSAALEPLADEDVKYCTECGEVYEDPEGQECTAEDCDGDLTPKRFLGWTCGDPGCDEVYFGRTPASCSCGKRKFVRSALFDVSMVDECQSCGHEFLPDGPHNCNCDTPKISRRARGYGNFRIIDDNGRLREASQFPGGLPCYHKDTRETYSKTRRYEPMLRGPANAAVTSGRYLLRSLADRDEPDTFSESKVLSFADSQSDMKELERNFREPEESFFFDQLFADSIRSEADESGWVPLSDIVECGVSDAQQYEEELKGENGNAPKMYESLTGYDQSVSEYLKEEMISRAFNGKYSNRYRSNRLSGEGLVDLRLTVDIEDLDEGERELLVEAVNQNHRYEPSLLDEVEEGHDTLASLVDKGILRRVEDDGSRYVMVAEDMVECAVVDDATPTNFSPDEEEYATTLDVSLGEAPDDVVEFSATIEERAEFSHPHYSLTAQQVSTSDPMMLLARAYYGETDRDERRKLEYQFRQGRYPHFLSSGPAMELGVDIGDLNTLLLYGTPPNANSYLQRIGRAGRSSGNSLIHSVSQRNPIDYYYHEHPEELIAADPQQVPLNEVNREVLHQSLTWAVLDWAATTRWVPWRREQSGLEDLVVCQDDPTPRTDSRPNDVIRFTGLLSSTNFEVQSFDDDAPLEALRSLLNENRSEIEQWLRDLLSFGVCSSCGRKHAAGYGGVCQREGCKGVVESVLDEHGDLIESILSGNGEEPSFEETIIDIYHDQQDAIYDDIDDLEDELDDLRRKERKTRDRDEKRRLREQRDQVDRQLDQLYDYLDRLEDMDYGSYLSQESPAAFGLRSVGDSVDYQLFGEDFERVSDGSRDRRIALSELHPCAAYLHDSETYVVTQLSWEPLESAQISDDLEDAAICPTCAAEYDSDTANCESCGTRLKPLVTQVPERVTAYQHDLPLSSTPSTKQLRPSAVYQNDSEPQNTYAPVETDAGDSFEPTFARNIVDENGTVHGQFEYGDVTLLASTNKYWATYKDGGSDPLPNVFEMCGVDGCNGVIARVGDSAYCTKNVEHPAEESVAVRPATKFATKAARVRFDSEELEHGFAHGLRVALQYIGGVSVRQVPESVEDEGTLVYDSDEGGAGITVLLTQDDGEKFERAVRLMREAFSPAESKCNCENGCPFCIFQYGCVEQNDPDSFDKEELLELLSHDLHLEPRKNE
ncbi:DEAD/DEAH box helicase [Halorubrum sp. CGM5_25_10-8B]|uniref:DEAD/DEAH box helicase n=1 Tax=Halorubrum sp. CGM5_25_10-8B TaxID=2518115 RepID=UPI0010F606A5|nr:DEAD/DEAH box helicase [Halorubrum sp. CGM5_25_10-8B]TKX37023.1 DEAD/DEAH box helicase [Halorubrum sp. CGM5_25_10-8B]